MGKEKDRNLGKGKEGDEEWGRQGRGILVKRKKEKRNGGGKGEESW
jgi:hypothetical protein